LVAVVLMLTACSSGQGGAVKGEQSNVATPNSSSRSGGRCEAKEVRQVLDRFVYAYNHGNIEAAAGLFAVEDFRWYSDSPDRDDLAWTRGGRQDPVSNPYDRSTLGAYLARKHGQGDRLEVTGFQYNGGGNFGMEFVRPNGKSAGKAHLGCYTTKFLVWSVGVPS
jgi:hypothetical protein